MGGASGCTRPAALFQCVWLCLPSLDSYQHYTSGKFTQKKLSYHNTANSYRTGFLSVLQSFHANPCITWPPTSGVNKATQDVSTPIHYHHCTVISYDRWSLRRSQWPAPRPKTWTVFTRSNTGIVGSNPTQCMDVWCVCVYAFILCLCCPVFR
jgi:hypothetical protein